jgi:sugar phosphate isomerase/epimerase
MKLGLLTAAFPSLSPAEVTGWASDNGFEALEIACWPAAAPSAGATPASATLTSTLLTTPQLAA